MIYASTTITCEHQCLKPYAITLLTRGESSVTPYLSVLIRYVYQCVALTLRESGAGEKWGDRPGRSATVGTPCGPRSGG